MRLELAIATLKTFFYIYLDLFLCRLVRYVTIADS